MSSLYNYKWSLNKSWSLRIGEIKNKPEKKKKKLFLKIF